MLFISIKINEFTNVVNLLLNDFLVHLALHAFANIANMSSLKSTKNCVTKYILRLSAPISRYKRMR